MSSKTRLLLSLLAVLAVLGSAGAYTALVTRMAGPAMFLLGVALLPVLFWAVEHLHTAVERLDSFDILPHHQPRPSQRPPWRDCPRG